MLIPQKCNFAEEDICAKQCAAGTVLCVLFGCNVQHSMCVGGNRLGGQFAHPKGRAVVE